MSKIINFIRSRIFIVIVVIVFGLTLLVGTFAVGVAIGYHKATFSYAWGENYHRNFGGPKGGFLSGFSGKDFIDGHGTFGQIVKIDGSTIVVKGSDNVEKVILINDDTSIMEFRGAVKLADLAVGENIVAIGEPDSQGQITAKFIRLMPTMTSPVPMMQQNIQQ